jgi:hypothetical protein
MKPKRKTPAAPEDLEPLRAEWAARWPAALALWSQYTRLSEPRWCLSTQEAQAEGLTDSFAMIRLLDHVVVVDLKMIQDRKLDAFALEILAHEIGHHVYCPADLTDHGRLIARMRYGLPTKEHLAGFIGNLYTDLLINNRLQRSANLNEAAVYETLGRASDRLWTLYMRMFEILWSRTRNSLADQRQIDAHLEGDAQLGARLIQSYARDWLDGAGKFAALCLPYLLENDGAAAQKLLRPWLDTQNAGAGATDVPGLTRLDGDEKASAIHPALDPTLSDSVAEMDAEIDAETAAAAQPPQAATGPGESAGQTREPFEYGAILKALGLNLSDHDVAVRYYKERATPHLIRFPSVERPQAADPLPEGLGYWRAARRGRLAGELAGEPARDSRLHHRAAGLGRHRRRDAQTRAGGPGFICGLFGLHAQSPGPDFIPHAGRGHCGALGAARRGQRAGHAVERRAGIRDDARFCAG